MTTAEQFQAAAPRPASTISIAGVDWPTYKVVALIVGFLTFAVVALVTAHMTPAVLSAAAMATLIWAGGGLLHSLRR